MTDTKLAHPHDHFMEELLSHPETAGGLLWERLPEAVAECLSTKPPKLNGYLSDRLFEVEVLNSKTAFLYVLVEHKSSPDHKVGWQLLRYLVEILKQWERSHPNWNRLPAIVPFVFGCGSYETTRRNLETNDEAMGQLEGSGGGQMAQRQAEEVAVHRSQDFDTFYDQARARPQMARDEGKLRVISARSMPDGKGIVMPPKGLHEVTRRAMEREEHKQHTRLSPGEKKNRKRMATMVAVYEVDPYPRTARSILGLEQPQTTLAEGPW